ncbi:ribonuclease HII [Xinfangfangia sp. CPCC 101601]|uniref:Ribonuclease HII n=1 Tax=Pseudogemmobacter lacusdianii TaxID=3069608 RepID=A0ABU0VUD9_9RHOB|nr:ribonuclease HII [Xinfangfangia sp. CPCC 101601]MDQ2065347.1 ribonuclease HII [Xinfangfangia sp. CPCC 101601]
MTAIVKPAKPTPDFSYETEATAAGARFVVGVDEVGRGPLAGPVTAAAVRLLPGQEPEGLRDSKVMTATARERVYDWLMEHAQVAVAHASVEEIDQLNILRASHLAMERAVAALGADYALIDGNMIPRGLSCTAKAIVKGDAVCLSIAAASVVAKVTRDRIMVDLAQQHPGYGWESNAGYPTKLHLQALLDFGVTPAHRRSFGPVHKILCQEVLASD